MRGTVIMRICSALALAAALACCSGDADSRRPEVQRARDARPVSDWRDYVNERRGFRVSLPPGWHRAELSLSPMVTDPVEILTVATFPLPGERGLCRSIAAVPPDEALVNLQERGRGAYGGPSFPPRPASFRPDPDLPGTSTWRYRAGGEEPVSVLDYWFGFGDAGRAFHVLVAVGEAAAPSVSRDAFRILDTLRFDPDVRPHWRSAG